MAATVRRIITFTLTLALFFFASKFMTRKVDDYWFQVAVLCGIHVILAVSLNLINGITGQFSIGHAGFYGVGAYIGATWTVLLLPKFFGSVELLKVGTAAGDAANLIIATLLGACAAGLMGLLVGIPSLRLRGDYLAMVTLGFGEVIRVTVTNIEEVGAARGFSPIPTLTSSNGLAAFWVGIVALAVIFMSRNLLQSVQGLTYLAVREDEIAADAMGVNTTRIKVSAFVIGSAFAGAAGSLYAHFNTGISPDLFGMETSILITTMVVLGGTGSITGSTIAAIVLYGLPEVLRGATFIKDYRLVIFSTLLVIMMLTRPQGFLGTKEIGWASLARFPKKLFGIFRRKPSAEVNR